MELGETRLGEANRLLYGSGPRRHGFPVYAPQAADEMTVLRRGRVLSRAGTSNHRTD